MVKTTQHAITSATVDTSNTAEQLHALQREHATDQHRSESRQAEIDRLRADLEAQHAAHLAAAAAVEAQIHAQEREEEEARRQVLLIGG